MRGRKAPRTRTWNFFDYGPYRDKPIPVVVMASEGPAKEGAGVVEGGGGTNDEEMREEGKKKVEGRKINTMGT